MEGRVRRSLQPTKYWLSPSQTGRPSGRDRPKQRQISDRPSDLAAAARRQRSRAFGRDTPPYGLKEHVIIARSAAANASPNSTQNFYRRFKPQLQTPSRAQNQFYNQFLVAARSNPAGDDDDRLPADDATRTGGVLDAAEVSVGRRRQRNQIRRGRTNWGHLPLSQWSARPAPTRDPPPTE
uniref:Uncharacterized protein n=1 Tax=Plectus sambesii TaxID=2011161 RepID=A0A914WCU2_9BILA